jgi:hypothetical protein
MAEQNFDLNACFSELREDVPEGQYAMWWPSEGDSVYTDAPARQAIRRAYAALDGIETYILGAFMALVGAEEAGVRIALPQEMTTRYLQDETGAPFILSVSREKGMRFHFHPDYTTPTRRDAFWLALAQSAEAWRISLAERGIIPTAEILSPTTIFVSDPPTKPNGTILSRLFGGNKNAKPQAKQDPLPMDYWETVDRFIVNTEAGGNKSEAVGTLIVES